MSQKQAKRDRRELRELRRVQDEVPAHQVKSSNRLKKAIVICATLGLSAVLGEIAYRQSGFGKGQEYTLDLFFMAHSSAARADMLLNRMDAAADSGKPYDVMLMEQAGEPEKGFEAKWTGIVRQFGNVRVLYADLVYGKKIEPAKAAEMCAENMRKNNNWGSAVDSYFESELFTGLALKRSYAAAIEEYGKADAEYLGKVGGELLKEQAKTNAITSSGKVPTLGYYAEEDGKENAIIREAELLRDKKTKEGLPDLMRKIRDMFPALRSKPVVRAIGFLGIEHYKDWKDFHPKGVKLQVELCSDSDPVSAEVLADVGYDRLKTKRELYVYASEQQYGLDEFLSGLLKVEPELAKKMISRAVSFTLKDWQDIDAKTANMESLPQRKVFMLNALAGKRIFELGERIPGTVYFRINELPH